MSYRELPVVLVDPNYQPPDRQGRWEVAGTLHIQAWLNYVSNIYQWFADRPLLACVLWSLWLSILYFGLGAASYLKVPDCGNGTLPARMMLAQQFVNGELGHWMSFSGCGIDRVVNNYRLEPQCVLLGILPGWLGYGLITWFQRFIAAYFMVRLTQQDLRFDAPTALLVAMCYSLFSQVGIHWQWDGFTLYDGLGIPGLPFLFWISNRLTETRSILAWILALVTGLTLGLTAPFFQTLFFPFLALFWYTVIQPSWTWKRLTILSCIFAGWAIIAMPEMLAAAKYVPDSHRSEIQIHSDSAYVKHIENVEHWGKQVLADNKHYLLAALAGFISIRFRDRRLAITLLVIGTVLLFVRYYYTIYDHTLAHMGILASFHFHRLIYLLPFLCSIAMGLGIALIQPETILQLANTITGLKIHVRPLIMMLLLLTILFQSLSVNRQRLNKIVNGESYQLLYHHPDIQALADANRDSPDFRVACVTDLWRPKLGMKESEKWSLSPGMCWAYGLETTDGYQVLYSKRYKHYWTQVLYPLLSQDSIRSRQHLYWANMLFLWHPGEKKQALMFSEHYNLPLLSLTNTRYIISPIPLYGVNLRLHPSPNRERFIQASLRKTSERYSAAMKNDWSYKPVYIYENQEYLPRYFLANQVSFFDEEFDLLANLRTATTEDLRTKIRLLRSDVPTDVDLSSLQNITTVDNLGTADCINKSADQAEYEIQATGACIFFLSNSYHPDWQAELNDKPATILPAQLAFQGIYIPTAGKHRLKLKYRPLVSPASYFEQ